ncbi:hypothetical protein G7Y79_00002g005840 [Physcia stellaris]|nr:hypothetical protein G7Y79_00002g005840 [Physcia stellaris]
MPPPLSEECKNRIVRAMRNGLSNAIIQDIEQVGDFVVRKIRRNLKNYGTHTAPRHKTGPKVRIPSDVAKALQEYLAQKPDAYQKEMVEYLREERGIKCDPSTVSRALQTYGLREANMRHKRRSENAGREAAHASADGHHHDAQIQVSRQDNASGLG